MPNTFYIDASHILTYLKHLWVLFVVGPVTWEHTLYLVLQIRQMFLMLKLPVYRYNYAVLVLCMLESASSQARGFIWIDRGVQS